MTTPDALLAKLQAIYQSFGQFCLKRGEVSEADTRHQVIDRILHEVLLWPRSSVKCEERTDVGVTDYVLYRSQRPIVVVEAKKANFSWAIPHGKLMNRMYQLSGVLQKEKEIDQAINQVQSYCNALGIRYAIASNGYSFIIFRAVSDSSPWRDGSALFFQGAKAIIDNFNVFIGALAFDNLISGSLDNIFIPKLGLNRTYDKPISHISNEDALYGRNVVSSLLQPYIEKFFGDISAQQNEGVFETCYVYSPALQEMDKNLKEVIKDEIPKYAEKEGFQELITSQDGGQLAEKIKNSNRYKIQGHSILLMGGIGSGKSTYLRRLIQLLSKEQIGKKIIIVYIDYLSFAPDLITLSEFTYGVIASNLKEHKSIISRDVLELIYKDDIDILKETRLYSIKDKEKVSAKIGEYLYQKMQDDTSFSEKAIQALIAAGITPILFFDNVDQLPIDVQIQIFTTAQYFSRQLKCSTILALREESYCTARMQKVFTAYGMQRFHISSPPFRKMIKLRIERSIEEIPRDDTKVIYVSGKKVTTPDLSNFLQVIHKNLLRPYKPVLRLIESISFGDMRYALNLINTFMTSGTTDVWKILGIYMKEKDYTVGLHEFVKSITLGEYRYYKEGRSLILNVFDVQPEYNSSHFTGLRVLKYLAENKNIASPEGVGFIELNDILRLFGDIFINVGDVKKTILKFIGLNRQLLELDTRATDTIEGSSYVRITPAGIIYQSILFKEFSYLDLVWQDTPINNSTVAHELALKIHVTDMEERIKRISIFLNYLKSEEASEFERFGLQAIKSPVTKRLIPEIEKYFESQCDYIKSKSGSKAAK